MAVVRRLCCTVERLVDHGEHVYTVTLRPETQAPSFRPGQFLHLALDAFEPGGFWPESRVFSIASSPSERDRLQITYAVKASFTTRMERELRVGRDVWVKLPYGEFTVDPGRDAVLFAGGTGVTAFTAFLGSLPNVGARQVALYYGARTPDLFVYGELATRRAAEVEGLEVNLVCEATDGRLSVEAAWPTISRMDAPLIYLSGPPAMLTALTAQLHDRGIDDGSIRTDAWE